MTITDQALVAAANLADRYISDRFLPDKAIDLIDEAGSRLRIRRMSTPPEYQKIDEELVRSAPRRRRRSSGRTSRRRRSSPTRSPTPLERKTALSRSGAPTGVDLFDVVDEDVIAEVLANWTGIPVYKLTEEETAKLLRMEDELHKRVVGQEDAINALLAGDPAHPGRPEGPEAARAGRSSSSGRPGSARPSSPRRSPSCSSATRASLIQLDMSEYMEKHTVSRLVGSPPGYVGYEEGGQLTEAVRRKPFAVVLFDEVEKAHPDVFNTLLQILEDGRLTDAQGRTVDFKNTVLIMTSNLGTSDLRKAALGFSEVERGRDLRAHEAARSRRR